MHAHHRETRSLAQQDPDMEKVATTTDEGNLNVIQKYCNNLYNHQNQVTVDFTILDDIKQRPVEKELGLTLTNEAPGESRVTTEALKALLDFGKDFIVSMIKSFLDYISKHYEEWNATLLRLLHKKSLKKTSQSTEDLLSKM